MGKKKKIKVGLAEQDRVNLFQSEVDVVLKALGHPEALVTDMSTVSDFLLSRKELKSASRKLGVPLLDDDYIWGVARRVRMKH